MDTHQRIKELFIFTTKLQVKNFQNEDFFVIYWISECCFGR